VGNPVDAAAGRPRADDGFGRLFWCIQEAAVVAEVATGRIMLWNPSAARMFGMGEAEANGMPIEMLLPDLRKHALGLAPDGETGLESPINRGALVELRARHKDGSAFRVHLSLTSLEDSTVGRRLALAIIRDATPDKGAETVPAETHIRPGIAAMGAEIGGALADRTTLDEALRRAADAVVRHFDAAFARIWTSNETEQMLELRASVGLYTHLDGRHSRVPVGKLKIGRIAADGKPYLSNDVLHDPQVDSEWAAREGMIAFAGYPLIVEQQVVGVLALFARRELDAETLEELSSVAEMIAQYIGRKYAQDKLERSERRFRAMIEHAHGIISILGADGTVLYESPYVEGVLGYPYGERVGTNGFDLIHPDERQQAFQTFTDLVAVPGAVVSGEFRFRHADGSWRWLEVTGHNLLKDAAVSGIVVHMRDVTERKRSELALQHSEERFRELIERSSDMITLHARDGTITYVSPSTPRLLGYNPSDLLGHSLLDAVHPDDQPPVQALFADVLRRPGEASTARYRLRHRDGSWRWLEATFRNLLEERAVGAVVVNRRDVTAEVEAQQRLEERVVERTRELNTVLELSGDLGSTLDLGRLLNLVLDRLRSVVPYTGAGMLVVEGDRLHQRAHYGPLEQAQALKISYPIAGWHELWSILTGGQPILIGNVLDDSRAAGIYRSLVDDDAHAPLQYIRTCLWVPLLVRDRLIGILAVTSGDIDAFTPHLAELAAAAASHAAIAIENARLYEALRDKTALEERQRLARELHDSVSQALYAIALNGAAAAESLRKHDYPRAARQVKHVRQLSRGGLAEMRALIFELRAESLAEEGLVAALAKQVAAVEARHELKIRSTFGREPAASLTIKEATGAAAAAPGTSKTSTESSANIRRVIRYSIWIQLRRGLQASSNGG
jgi:PAS domain S-box-containing protein